MPAIILPLKGKDFKVESAKEDKVGDKPAVVLKIVGPDKKDFELFFDKESGLPVKMTATVAGFQGEEFTQESTYNKYKEFDGVKRATKVENKRDGQKFIDMEITDVKVLDKTDPKTFGEPPQNRRCTTRSHQEGDAPVGRSIALLLPGLPQERSKPRTGVFIKPGAGSIRRGTRPLCGPR